MTVSSMVWDFSNSGTYNLMRYWLSTLIRAVMRNDSALLQNVLNASGNPWLLIANQGASPDPNIPLWAAASYPGNVTLIVVGGTYLPSQWYGHIGGLGMSTGPWQGRVHTYWANTATALAAQITGTLGSLPAQRFFLVGHSWGGACCQILNYLLAAAYPGSTFQTVTFGAPKVGNADFGRGFNAYLVNDKIANDPITFLPPYVNSFQKFLVLGVSSLFFANHYAHAGVAFEHGGGPGRGLGTAGLLSNDNGALLCLLTNREPMRNHQLYYYAKHYFRSVELDVASRGPNLPADLGFDFEALNTQNGIISQAEGLVVTPAWPVPENAEP